MPFFRWYLQVNRKLPPRTRGKRNQSINQSLLPLVTAALQLSPNTGAAHRIASHLHIYSLSLSASLHLSKHKCTQAARTPKLVGRSIDLTWPDLPYPTVRTQETSTLLLLFVNPPNYSTHHRLRPRTKNNLILYFVLNQPSIRSVSRVRQFGLSRKKTVPAPAFLTTPSPLWHIWTSVPHL